MFHFLATDALNYSDVILQAGLLVPLRKISLYTIEFIKIRLTWIRLLCRIKCASLLTACNRDAITLTTRLEAKLFLSPKFLCDVEANRFTEAPSQL